MNSKTKKIIMYCSIIGFVMIATGTFAYFKSGDAYNVKGQVISWSFKAESKGDTESFTKALGDIAPGSTGSFVVNLDPTGSTTNVECSITPNIASSLAGMKLYSDSAKTTEITADNPLKVNLTARSSAQNVTVYWLWEYDTGLLTNQSITFSINVVGKQAAS